MSSERTDLLTSTLQKVGGFAAELFNQGWDPYQKYLKAKFKKDRHDSFFGQGGEHKKTKEIFKLPTKMNIFLLKTLLGQGPYYILIPIALFVMAPTSRTINSRVRN